MAKIKETLNKLNPWWKEELIINFKERDVYEEVSKFLELPQIISFTGLRRVGKTSLMFKIIKNYLDDKFNPLNIIYFSFDEFKEVELSEIIKEYEGIMEKDFGKEKYLLLLDEIQKVSNWESQLKAIYDLFKGKVKIIISGSESLFIRKKSKESLAGRIFEFKVELLSFKEFLIFKDFDYKKLNLNIHEKELARLFNEYKLSLGFPELVNIKDKDIIRKYLKETILEKIIYNDLQKLFRIKVFSIVESLINILIEEPGQIIDMLNLARDLNISRQTLSNYLNYLEKSFLIRKLYNFSKNKRKVERKLKKYYPGIISADLLFKEDEYSGSKVFEWLIVTQLKAEFFWRDVYKNEVDIILKEKPIEVKYGNLEFNGVIKFMKKFNVKKGYIISKNKEQRQKINGNIIEVIPAYKFLLRIDKTI